ncbi:hypothetical protein NP233_g12002 [Leucocoprinus birnbaumii]|uniref:Uncharacterized protein n=1 Tax=Leucocoprinus birnbaumii TaxID=56174 RepID=A0AAD5VHV4_9AGAR|nr:hypothetical protein NP233_g12002 [Leucocoprinus birnbaumii]
MVLCRPLSILSDAQVTLTRRLLYKVSLNSFVSSNSFISPSSHGDSSFPLIELTTETDDRVPSGTVTDWPMIDVSQLQRNLYTKIYTDKGVQTEAQGLSVPSPVPKGQGTLSRPSSVLVTILVAVFSTAAITLVSPDLQQQAFLLVNHSALAFELRGTQSVISETNLHISDNQAMAQPGVTLLSSVKLNRLDSELSEAVDVFLADVRLLEAHLIFVRGLLRAEALIHRSAKTHAGTLFQGHIDQAIDHVAALGRCTLTSVVGLTRVFILMERLLRFQE